jgi:hypothetical protein
LLFLQQSRGKASADHVCWAGPRATRQGIAREGRAHAKKQADPDSRRLRWGRLAFSFIGRGAKPRPHMGAPEATRTSPQGRPSGGRAQAPAPLISSYPLRTPKLRVSRGQRPWGPPWQGGFGWVDYFTNPNNISRISFAATIWVCSVGS